jgi:hypothetical protein
VAVVGLAALIVGLAMVVAPESSPAFWPWTWEVAPGPPGQLDGLTHRLVAVMFIGLAAGAAFTVWQGRRDVAEVYLAMLSAYTVVGALSVLLFVAQSPTTPAMWAYLALLVAIAVCTLVALQPDSPVAVAETSPTAGPTT